MSDLNELAREIRGIKGDVFQVEEWCSPYKIPALLALIHAEVSGALEAFRRDDRENFAEKLADTLFRVLDIAGGLGWQGPADFDAVVRRKLEKHRGRGYHHGGKRV